jgi:hypothetical protein
MATGPDDNRVVLGVAPAKGHPPPSALGATPPSPRQSRWTDAAPAGRGRSAGRHGPAAARCRVGVTAHISNGVEVWLKPTDFKADQVVFNAYALAAPSCLRPTTGTPAAAPSSGRLGLSRWTSGRCCRPILGLGRHGHSHGIPDRHAKGPETHCSSAACHTRPTHAEALDTSSAFAAAANRAEPARVFSERSSWTSPATHPRPRRRWSTRPGELDIIKRCTTPPNFTFFSPARLGGRDLADVGDVGRTLPRAARRTFAPEAAFPPDRRPRW